MGSKKKKFQKKKHFKIYLNKRLAESSTVIVFQVAFYPLVMAFIGKKNAWRYFTYNAATKRLVVNVANSIMNC